MKVYVVLELPVGDHGHVYGAASVQGVYQFAADAHEWVRKHTPYWRSFIVLEREIYPQGELGPADENK